MQIYPTPRHKSSRGEKNLYLTQNIPAMFSLWNSGSLCIYVTYSSKVSTSRKKKAAGNIATSLLHTEEN